MRYLRLLITIAAVLLQPVSAVLAAGAEVVLLIGQGDSREETSPDWNPVAVKQQIQAGSFARTRSLSQMGLLLGDRTQIRLNQNSQLQIKSIADGKQWNQTTVKLQSGRAWSQAKPQIPPGQAKPQDPLSMETPTATMAIRGTDWEVEVAPDGRTQLVVLSGVVDIGNEYGSLSIASGEAAIAELGKAPVKLILVNPRERVQWVTSYRPEPRRWVPHPTAELANIVALIASEEYAKAVAALSPDPSASLESALLRADLYLFEGNAEAATALLSPYAKAGEGDPLASALLARAMIIADRIPEATRLLASAQAKYPENIELLLAKGDLASLEGVVVEARAAYTAARKYDPDRMEAWLGLGRIEVELENVTQAHELLEKANTLDPESDKPPAQLATLATFSNDFVEANQLFEKILAERPYEYVALTGRGILKLKTGNTQGALEDFLRAEIIEPRYARAWLFSGVAYYQLGDRKRALEAFAKAASIDTHDPLPYLVRSMVHTDAMKLGEAIEDAEHARELMPYLKSLNQIANNQKGNADLGSPLATFGLEEWAQHLAYESYSPWWAGSHLFLADRYLGNFNKNTELFKGFLTDPTVFGVSNRDSSLVAVPGNYGSVDAQTEYGDYATKSLIMTANGLNVDKVPIAYFVSGDVADADSRLDKTTANGTNLTLGLGIRPNYNFGIFGFVTDSRIRADVRSPKLSLPDDNLTQEDTRIDVGFNYKLAAENQIWLKLGGGKEHNKVNGGLFSPSIASSLGLSPSGELDKFDTDVKQYDIEFRHTLAASDDLDILWGVEYADQNSPVTLDFTFSPISIHQTQRQEVDTTSIWAGMQYRVSPILTTQLELFFQQTDSRLSEHLDANNAGVVTVLNDSVTTDNHTELNPRIGINLSPAAGQLLRFAAQRWRRPASPSSLMQTDTLGIALNDRLVTAGGLYQQIRLQYEWNPTNATFIMAFAGNEKVHNLISPEQSIASDFELTELDILRNRRLLFGAPYDYYEGDPEFGKGEINSFGIALNQLVSLRQTIAMRYVYADSRNTGQGFSGLELPFIPQHTLRLASQWLLPNKWALSLLANWRSERFEDERNLKPLDAGWNFGAGAYWESIDKRWLFESRLENLRTNKDSSVIQKAVGSLQLGYRF